jgi:hypothetical protein
MYLIGQSRSRKAAQAGEQFLERTEGAQPAAEDTPSQEDDGHRHIAPENENQRLQQEEVPGELGCQRIEESQDVDDRQLRAGEPADPDQGEEQKSRPQTLIKLAPFDHGVLEHQDHRQD